MLKTVAIYSTFIFITLLLVKKVEAAEDNSVRQSEVYMFKVRNSPPNPTDDNSEKLKFKLEYDEEEALSDMNDDQAKARKLRFLRDSEGYPVHRFIVAATNTSYAGRYDYTGTATTIPQKTMTHRSSAVGSLFRYQYAPTGDFLYETEVISYSASDRQTKGGTGAVTSFLTSTDSTESGYSLSQSANRCWWRYEGGSSICPGFDIGYDMFPVLSIRETSISPVRVELMRTAAWTAGLNMIGFYPISNTWLFNWSAGYRVSIGGTTDQLNNSGTKSYYATTDIIWSFFEQHGLLFGVNYTNRSTNVSSKNRRNLSDSGDVSTTLINLNLGYVYRM